MSKLFKEVAEKIRKNAESKGRKILSFSRSEYNELATSILNTPEHKVETVKLKGGELVKTIKEPVKEFRGFIKGVLKDFGVDEQEAANIETKYQFKETKTTWLYDLAKEVDYQYMSLGKKLDFPTRKDFTGSISLDNVKESTNTYKAPKTGVEGKIKKKAHVKLKAKSKPGKWLKEKVK
jgi:hypothetical protein